jgi:hypothetical protein
VIRQLRALWRNYSDRQTLNEDLDEEVRGYLEMLEAEKVRRGMAPDEALREARRKIEGLEQVKQRVRDSRNRSLDRHRGAGPSVHCSNSNEESQFRLRGIPPLVLSIGRNTAIFTVVNGVLLKPLPYPDPDRLLMLWVTSISDRTLGTVAPANFYDWPQQSHSCGKMAALDPYPDFILNGAGEKGSGEAERRTSASVSPDFFSLLETHMAVGRDFLPQEDHPGSNQVVVLSYSIWQRLFGGRADIVGTLVRLNDSDYAVVGVLPSCFSLVS